MIASRDIQYVSFDIFDTLIKRAVYEPTDIFYLMAEHPKVKKYFSDAQAFYDKRIVAEQRARDLLHQRSVSFEDVTLDEIYSTFCTIFRLPSEVGQELKEIEEEYEYKYCFQRESAKELFDLAIYLGKTVFITSDMYISEQTIRRILDKNGYTGYKKIYLSSEHRRLKATGNLFEYAIKDLSIKDKREVLHIGDNWNVDILMAQKVGLKTFFMPKCKEVFENRIPSYATNNMSAVFIRNTEAIYDNKSLMKQLPIRCMLAVVVNKLFDNPFQKCPWDTDYNRDSYLTGYYTLGMHMFGIVNWMYQICKAEGYRVVHFLARDGKLAKRIFDEYLIACKDESIKTDYFYATRKSLLPYLIEKKEDFYNINQCMEIEKHKPEDILNIYAPILNPLTDALRKEYFKRGVILDREFTSYREFVQFINVLQDLSSNEQLFGGTDKRICEAIRQHFSEHEVTFDIGYSGRLQSILNKVTKKSIDVLYIHQEGDNAQRLGRRDGFKVHSFYDFTPKMSGIVREFFISDPAPSCIGYEISNEGTLIPILEDKEFHYQENYPLRKFQQGAYDFCKDMFSLFGHELDMFSFRPLDASAAFEYYLLNAKNCDRWVFSVSRVEDDVYSGYSAKNLYEIWTWHLNQIERANVAAISQESATVGQSGHEKYPFLYKKSKLEKACFYFFYDRSIFNEKFRYWKKVRKNTWR